MKRRLGRLPVLVAWVLLAALAPAADAAPRDAKSRALERSHAAAESALTRAQAIREGRGVVNGRELTPALAELSARYEALDPAERREADRLLARPTDGAGDPQGDGYTVPEHAPFCTANFCLHWVTSTPDAPDLTDTDGDDVPDYVETMAAQFELSRTHENGNLGWRLPVSDGARGGDGRLDIYLIELAGTNVLGYAATDPGQADAHSKFAYMAMDQALADDVLQATAAHEYNHVLQFAYDAAQDTWMFESTAVWMEDVVFDPVDHYLGFIPTWATLDEIPLAKTFQTKHYGSGVWNMWLDERHGPELIRTAWAGSPGASPQSFAPGAYDAALLDGGFDGFSASFVEFVADVAEWRTASAFPEGAAYTDVQRRGNLQAGGAAVAPSLDHTAFALYTIPQPAAGWPAVLRLDGELPAGVTGGLALVARTGGDPLAGTVTKVEQQLPSGGAGSVQLADPASYGRITAVLVNADTDTTAFQGGDWVFSADAQPFTAAAGVSSGISASPVNTVAPSVSGTPRDGSQLTAANGTWSGSAPMAYARQWRRCDSGRGACEDIAGATGARYTATAGDVGHALRVRVNASNGAGGAAADSGPTAAVVAIAPAFGGTAPVIDDTTPAVGQTLNVTDGTWTGSQPLTMTYQWRRCTTTALNTCTNIPLATASAYTVTADDATKRLRVTVAASNSAGSASRDTAATEAVSQPSAGPANTALPTVSGVANDGETLTAGAGTWSGSPTPTVTREWLRCSGTDVATCAGTGSTGTTYVLAPADVGSRLRVRETAQNSGGTANATSAATVVVTADAPHNTALPQITGTASQGQPLTATDGSWSGTPPSFARQWRRCDGGTCTDIGGASGSSYQPAAADVGKTIVFRVTATNAAGSESADSLETATVAGPPVNAQLPAVSGVANDGETLTAQSGAWTGSPAPTLTRTWMRCSGAGVDTCAATGASGVAYVLGPSDVGSRMRVRERAQNGSGTVDALSAATAVVTADALNNDAPPGITGTAKDGELLTAADGTWSGTPPTFARRWRRCDGAACADIAGATASTYRLTSQDVGKTIRVAVTATNAAGSADAESAPTAAVAALPVANTIAPSLSGDAVDGAELTSAAGSWTGSTPILLTRRWQRCSGLTCTDIPGAVGERYRLGLADVLQQVRVVVTGSNAAGAVEAPSARSAQVRAAPAQPSGGSPGGGTPGGGAPAGPPSPAAALSATVRSPAKAKLAAALAGKLAVPVDCSASCKASARVELTKKAAKKLGVPAVLARGSRGLTGAGRVSVKLSFASKARRKLRKARTVTTTLVVEVRDAAGALAAQRRGKLTLRR